MMKVGQDRVKKMLTDTVSLLCKNSLQYEGEISIEGLLGIKVDKKDVFFVHISENFGKDGQQLTRIQEQMVISDGVPAKKKRRKAAGQAAAAAAAAKKLQQQQVQQQHVQQQQIQQQQIQQQQIVTMELPKVTMELPKVTMELPKVTMEDVKTEEEQQAQAEAAHAQAQAEVQAAVQATECHTVLTTHDGVKLETVQQVAEMVAGQRRVALRAVPKELQHAVQEVTLHPANTEATQAVYEAAATQATFAVQQAASYDPPPDAEGRVPTSQCPTTADTWPTIAATMACVDTISVAQAQATFQASQIAGETVQTWSLPAGVVVQTEADTITTLSQPVVQTTTLTTDVAGQQQFTLPKYKWTMLEHRAGDAPGTVRLQDPTQAQQVVAQQQTQVQQVQQVQVTAQQVQVTQQQAVTQAPTTAAVQAAVAVQAPVAVTVAVAAPPPAAAQFTKNRECPICGKTFLLDSSLKRHLRAHAGKKPYKCELCEAAFIQSSDLKKHFRSHTGEKPYSCSICGMAFSQVGDRNRHQARHNRLGKA